MLLHQPLLPLNSTPPAKAESDHASEQYGGRRAVVVEDSEPGAGDAEEQRHREQVAALAHPAGAVRPSVKPSTRADWLADDSGQTLRQTPGARKNSAGRSGTTIPKKTAQPGRRPDQQQRRPATRYDATLTTRTPRQTRDRDPARQLLVGAEDRVGLRSRRRPGRASERRRPAGRRGGHGDGGGGGRGPSRRGEHRGAPAGTGCVGAAARTIRSVRPIRSTSPSASWVRAVTGRPLSSVPLRLPRSTSERPERAGQELRRAGGTPRRRRLGRPVGLAADLQRAVDGHPARRSARLPDLDLRSNGQPTPIRTGGYRGACRAPVPVSSRSIGRPGAST